MKSLIVYLRTLKRNKLFSVISIGGFSLSLAVVLLLLAFIRSENQVDRSIPDLDQIYRVVSLENSAYVPEQARDKLLADYPQVKASTNVNIGNDPVLRGEENSNVRVIHTDSGFFKVFSLPVVAGQREGLFGDPHQAVLTESCAKRIFGEENPIGQILNVAHREDVEVVAVVGDLPEKSSLQGEMFCSAELRIRYSRSGYNDQEAYLYNLYLKLHEGCSPEGLDTALTPLIHPFMNWMAIHYHMQPFREVYFDISTPYDNLSHANVKLIRLLGWLALVILLLALFNYINLAIAQSTGRLHELGVKQVFGADRRFLIRQFIHEAFVQVLVALILGFFIALLLNPAVSGILEKEIRIMTIMKDPLALLLVFAGVLLISMGSGFYPALAILRLQPKQMLLNQVLTIRRSFHIRRVLTFVQFTAMVALIISLITLVKQVRFVQEKNMGYDTELLVRIPVHYRISDRVPALLEEISKMAVVKQVCASHGTPGDIWNYSSDDNISTSHISSNHRFIETFGLSLLYGRNFFEAESTMVSLINETMMNDQGGWDSVENRNYFGSTVVGVVEDFHYKDLYSPIENLQIRNEPDVSHLCVRFYPGDIALALRQVQEVFRHTAPGFAFSYEFYDEWLDARYKQEEKRAGSIRLLSIIAVLLSCMGLFGMAEFSTRARTREIGIRKVNGASVGHMIGLLNLGFLKWVGPGILAGIPLGWYFMKKWLSGFAYRTSLEWWIFALAAIASLAVAVLTVSWQTWRTAKKNPVESLRYE
ncbi:MAG: FtsX-like permease family protein [Bacteroidota bacterium]